MNRGLKFGHFSLSGDISLWQETKVYEDNALIGAWSQDFHLIAYFRATRNQVWLGEEGHLLI